MSYQVNKFNGAIQTTVADGTIDSTTDLRFVGKNYAGYGEVQNENFLHLMENFSNTTAPPKAVPGQLWFDSSSAEKKIKFYDGTKWKVANGAQVSLSEPSGLSKGEFWWDDSAKQLYAWSGTDFVLVGPQAGPDAGASSVTAVVIKDNVDPVANNHSIIKLIAGGETVAIISPDEFTPGVSTGLLSNFGLIKKGLTLANTNASTGVTSTEHRFWGTASNALKLDGYSSAEYVKVGDPFNNTIVFKDGGYTLGNDTDLAVFIESDKVIFENKLANSIVMRISELGVPNDVAIFTTEGVYPAVPAVDVGQPAIIESYYTLGNTTHLWKEVHATDVYADLTGNVTGSVTGNVTGNIVATDATVLINATTKQIGYPDAKLVGGLVGSVEGSLQGTASNANTLALFSPTEFLPTGSNKASIPVRSIDGDITAVRFLGIASNTNKLQINDATSDVTWSPSDTSTWYRTARTTKTPYTIAARNATGDILANIFDGTATAAQYADLAEKYLADKEYDAGTVVMIGGEKEVTASVWGKRAIGVVSTNPAFMMNKDLDGGTYIALKGRVPCRVIGRIKKGDELIASNDGTAMMAVPHASGVFAVALESSDDESIKTIEVLVL